MREHVYFVLMYLIIFLNGFIVASINNYWIELLVLPIVCGGTAGWLYSKVLKECRKEAIFEAILWTLKTMVQVENEMALNKEEKNEQSKETME